MSSSGSEEFYDAEDNTPSHGTRYNIVNLEENFYKLSLIC